MWFTLYVRSDFDYNIVPVFRKCFILVRVVVAHRVYGRKHPGWDITVLQYTMHPLGHDLAASPPTGMLYEDERKPEDPEKTLHRHGKNMQNSTWTVTQAQDRTTNSGAVNIHYLLLLLVLKL